MADASAHLQQLKIQCTKKKTVKILLGLLLAGVILIVVVAIVAPNTSQQHVSELKENANKSKELQTMLTTPPDYELTHVTTTTTTTAATRQQTITSTTLTVTSISTETSVPESQNLKHLLNNRTVTWKFLDMQLKTSCFAIHIRHPDYASGVYTIYPFGVAPGRFVWCDMETDGGGWTRFQHRQDGSVSFKRTWASYQKGFGSGGGEFWLGNEDLHRLTESILSELRVELWDWNGGHGYAHYSTFSVSSARHNYALRVGGYSGTIGDSLANHNNRQFTTIDRDNDKRGYSNCAAEYGGGGWWYNKCHHSCLNGRYMKGPRDSWWGVNWRHWQNHSTPYSYKATAMLTRPLD